MKSLPEDDMMNELRKRLTNYTEEPEEEAWDKIAAGLPVSRSWVRPVTYTVLFILYSSLLWLAGNQYAKMNITLALKENTYVENNSSKVTEPDSCKTNRSTQNLTNDTQVQNRFSPFITTSTNRAGKNEPIFKQDDLLNNPAPINVMDFSSENKIHENSANQLVNEFLQDTILVPKDSILSGKNASDTLTRKKEVKKRKIFKPGIYVMAGPSLAYQKIAPFLQDEIVISRLNSKGIFSSERIGLCADVGFQWDLSRRLSVYTGLSYYEQNTTISYSYESGKVQSIEQSGNPFNYILNPEVLTQQLSYKMRNSGIATGALYQLQGTKLKHSIGAGLLYQIGLLTQNKNENYSNSGSAYLNYQVLYRMEILMSDKYHLFVQPNYTHVLLSKEKLTAPFTIQPYRAGISFGCTYFFRYE